MTHILTKQPNGKLSLWCTDVNNFVMVDATAADILEYELTREEARIIEWIAGSLERPQATYAELTQVYRHLGQDWTGA